MPRWPFLAAAAALATCAAAAFASRSVRRYARGALVAAHLARKHDVRVRFEQFGFWSGSSEVTTIEGGEMKRVVRSDAAGNGGGDDSGDAWLLSDASLDELEQFLDRLARHGDLHHACMDAGWHLHAEWSGKSLDASGCPRHGPEVEIAQMLEALR